MLNKNEIGTNNTIYRLQIADKTQTPYKTHSFHLTTVLNTRKKMPLFGKSQKSPADVVKALKEAVNSLEKGDKKAEKAQEDVSKNLVLIKNMLYGTSDAEPQTDIIVAQLAQELYNSNLLLLLIQNLNRIDFEGKKDVAQVFNNILRRQIGTRSPTVEYICTKPEILFTLMTGFVEIERECAQGVIVGVAGTSTRR